MRLNKLQLDFLSTILGAIAGISTVFVTFDVIPQKVGGSVGGVAVVLLGLVTQRPADKAPNTEDVEEQESKS